jgi:hypothetical protein
MAHSRVGKMDRVVDVGCIGRVGRNSPVSVLAGYAQRRNGINCLSTPLLEIGRWRAAVVIHGWKEAGSLGRRRRSLRGAHRPSTRKGDKVDAALRRKEISTKRTLFVARRTLVVTDW